MRRALIRRKLGAVHRVLDRAINAAEMPGAVVLARMPREGEMLEHESVRGRAVLRPEQVPMARDTLFDLASLTKVLATTSAVMLLAQRGALALDEPVARYLPAFGERGKAQLTLRHLLTHSSGLHPWRPYHELLLARERKKHVKLIGTPEARRYVLDSIFRSALVHESGTAAVYGDLDFIVLGALVEEITGETLDVFCRREIFEPLGMLHTGFNPLRAGAAPVKAAAEEGATDAVDAANAPTTGEAPAAAANANAASADAANPGAASAQDADSADAASELQPAAPVKAAPPAAMQAPPPAAPIDKRRIAATENCPWRRRILWGEVHDPNASVMGGVAGHAGLFGTADDIMRFAGAVLDAWHGKDGLFAPDWMRRFAARQGLPEGSNWALGWDTPSAQGSSAGRLFSADSIGHLGFTGTSLWIDLPAQAVVVMLASRMHLVAKQSRFALRAEVHDLLREAFAA